MAPVTAIPAPLPAAGRGEGLGQPGCLVGRECCAAPGQLACVHPIDGKRRIPPQVVRHPGRCWCDGATRFCLMFQLSWLETAVSASTRRWSALTLSMRQRGGAPLVGRFDASCGFPWGGDGHACAIRAGPGAVGTPAGAPGARQPDGGSAVGARVGAGGARRGGGGQVRAAGVRGRGGAGYAGGPCRRSGIGNGAGVRRPSSAVRAAARSAGASSGSRGRRGGNRVRGPRGERPLLCLVDDAQWLDRVSAQVLAFVARRLLADPVGLIFAARDPGRELGGLPDLEVRGLPDEEARTLLRSVVGVRLDERVRDRIVAETQGNPLALLELPRGLSPAQLAGEFGLMGVQAIPGRIEESFRNRLGALPADTRLLLLVAAAEPAGDPVLVWRAAERLRACAPAGG